MGMTDKQFVSLRLQQLLSFREMLEIAIRTNADPVLISKLKDQVFLAEQDTKG